ncbi:MAG: U32 family peptidase [Proteobacteria bacterium]|nr:U32 family peptidase [Pseudomonadota bacterium]
MITTNAKKVQLLAPAGNFEKLEIAVHYGADAVYLAGKAFSLRNFSENFTLDEIESAVKYAHQQDVKVYVACNIYARNAELKKIAGYLKALKTIGPDAVIIADPGVFMAAGSLMKQIPVHLSTQANTTNYQSARFWESLGVQRINVSRELSLNEIKKIARHCSLEIEAFVHGAMCISYSGRCLLSNFLAGRSGNLGSCTQSCRWKYFLVEEFRPGQYLPFSEDDRGSYIFNSRDLCMIEHIPAMIQSGVNALKIEGRMKGINYLAATVKVYREAIDAYYDNPGGYRVKKEWIEELERITHRGYCTGFYLGTPGPQSMQYKFKNKAGHTFIGKVIKSARPFYADIDVRNKIFKGDEVEVLMQKGPARQDKIIDMFDEFGQPLGFAQPGSRVTVALHHDYAANDLIRRADNNVVL